MKAGITLADALERHRQNPLTFPIPRQFLMRSIRPGDRVKVAVEAFGRTGADEPEIDGERFWLRVTKVYEQGFEGRITSDLLFTKDRGLASGDCLFFEPRHILDVETIEQQTIPKLPGCDDFALLTPEFLNGELPRVRAGHCELNGHMFFTFARRDNEIVAMVILHHLASRESSLPLNAAAKSLGFVPKEAQESNGGDDRCGFSLSLPPDIDGPQLQKLVRESVDALYREATRILSSRNSDRAQPQPATILTPSSSGRDRPSTQSPTTELPRTLPPWTAGSCLQCMHGVTLGYPIPDHEITLEIARSFCPYCRASLPFEKLDCPISHEQLMDLCDYIEGRLQDRPCDYALHLAEEFCLREGLPVTSVIEWLNIHGGHCDCEVARIVAARWTA